MHAYLLQTGRQLPPLGPVTDVCIHNTPMSQHQQQLLEGAGCKVRRITSLEEVEHTPCLLIHDDVYFTAAVVKQMLRAGRHERSSANLQVALQASNLTELLMPELQGPRQDDPQLGSLRLYDAYVLRKLDRQLPLSEQARPWPLRCRIGRISSRAHKRFTEAGAFVVPLSIVYISPLRHWANMIACNMLGMPAHFLQVAGRRWLSTALLPLKVALRAGSLRPARLAGKAYLSGKRCRVHPTANVEGAVLGDRVRIGPFANVRFSTIGDLAVIGSNACIEGCSIGRRAIVNGGLQLRGSIYGDETSIGTEFNQMSVVGHRSVICPGVALLDFSLRGTVAVTIDGQSVRTGSMILGGALGNDVFAGPGVSLLAGASVPSGWALVKSPRELIRGSDPPQVPDVLRRMDRYGIRKAA